MKEDIIMNFYIFLYCDCIYESSYATMSLHRTKLGAYKAMRKHKIDAYNKWYQTYSKSERKYFKFGSMEDWAIGEQKLLD